MTSLRRWQNWLWFVWALVSYGSFGNSQTVNVEKEVPISPEVMDTLHTRNCATKHLRDAIALNDRRAPAYAQATDGRSWHISLQLIGMEKLSLPATQLLDWRVRAWNTKGIPVLCADFVDMAGAQPVRIYAPEEIDPIENFVKVKALEVAGKLRSAWKAESYEGLHEAAEIEMHHIDHSKQYNCLLRHLLESIARSAFLSPQYLAKAETLVERQQIKQVMDLFLHAQIMLLAPANHLDREAASLQSEGVPIIFHDVPPIPTKVFIH